MREYLFVILLIVGITIAVSVGQSYAPGEENPYSSENEKEPGSLAYYLLLKEYTSVERLKNSFGDLEQGTVLMINPVWVPSPTEKNTLFTWVSQGNKLVVFSSNPEVMQAFGATLKPRGRRRVTVYPVKEHWSTQDVRAITVVYDKFFWSHTGDVLFADDGNPLIVEVEKGKGHIFLISTPSLVSNTEIDLVDNEIFLVQLSLSDKVYFDEYHARLLRKGEGINLETFKIVFTSRYVSFFVQLMLAVTFFLFAHGKRFGVSRPLPAREVQSSELVLSAADLYYKAGKKEILEMIEKEKSDLKDAKQKR